MRQHGDEIVTGHIEGGALFPYGVEIFVALPQLLKACLWGIKKFRIGNVLRGVRPIDELVPILLGDGIPMLPSLEKAVSLHLVASKVYPTGIVILRYSTDRR